MAYNKAKAEKEWLRWKEVEEKKLRELGVDEETIQRLHTYDWAQFNSIIIINIKKNASVVRKRVSDFQKNFLKHTGNRMVTGCQ